MRELCRFKLAAASQNGDSGELKEDDDDDDDDN